MSKKLPDTSHAANKAATLEMRQQHYEKILSALHFLGSAIYEEVGNYTGLDKHQVGRRLSEMERAQMVWKPGAKMKTSSGRMAYMYSPMSDNTQKTHQPDARLTLNDIRDHVIDKELKVAKSSKNIEKYNTNLNKEKMTHKEHLEHILSTLRDNKNHTIVKHMLQSGKICYRIRDVLINPIANMPESIFKELEGKSLLNKLNDREWQLKP